LPGEGTLAPLTVLSFRGHTFSHGLRGLTAAGFKGAAVKSELVDLNEEDGWLRCLRITYHLPPAAAGELPDANVMVGTELPGNVAALRVRFLDDGSANQFALTVVDGSGERFCFGVASLTKPGWRIVDVPLMQGASHWDGNNDAVLDYPLRLGAVTMLRGRGDAEEFGAVYLDSVEALCDFGSLPVVGLTSFAPGAPERWESVAEACAGGVLDFADDPTQVDHPASRFTYQLAPAQGEGVVCAGITTALDTPLEVPGTLLLDVFGDAGLNILTLEVTDAAGTRWRGPVNPFVIDWVGWRTVYLFTGGRAWRSSTPEEAGRAGPYPLRFRSIRLGPRGPWFNDSLMQGSILLRDLRFAPGSLDVLATAAPQMTDVRDVPSAR
jgi:hypothetical protein